MSSLRTLQGEALAAARRVVRVELDDIVEDFANPTLDPSWIARLSDAASLAKEIGAAPFEQGDGDSAELSEHAARFLAEITLAELQCERAFLTPHGEDVVLALAAVSDVRL